MKKILLIVLCFCFHISISAQIKIGYNKENLAGQFPTEGAKFNEIKLLNIADGKWDAETKSTLTINKESFTSDNCLQEKKVTIGGKILFYKLDCTDNKWKVTFFKKTILDSDRIVVYYVEQPEPIFVREGLSVIKKTSGIYIYNGGEQLETINFYKDGTFNEFAQIDGKDAVINEASLASDTEKEVKAGATSLKLKIKSETKVVTISSDPGSPDRWLQFQDGKFVEINKPATNSPAPSPYESGDLLPGFPVKIYTENKEKQFNPKNRILVLDSDPRTIVNGNNSGLKKIKKEDKDESSPAGIKLVPAYALPNTGYLFVALNSKRLYQLESLSIEMDDVNYSYEGDLKSLRGLIPETNDDNKVPISGQKNQDESSKLDQYLTAITDTLKELNYLHIDDFKEIAKFKKQLDNYYIKHKNEFDSISLAKKNEIMRWYPENILLTDAFDVPEKDEVEIKYKSKKEGENLISKSLGNFKTIGRFSVGYGAALFYTNLVNSTVYKQTTTIQQSTDSQPAITETKAKIDTDNGSFGFGINLDMSYKTGSEIRPTLNFGFFVPLDEQITPYATTGIGAGLFGRNYKVNFSYGLAAGKINAVKKRYENVDLTGLEVEESDLTESVMKFGHYFALAVSFNIGK